MSSCGSTTQTHTKRAHAASPSASASSSSSKKKQKKEEQAEDSKPQPDKRPFSLRKSSAPFRQRLDRARTQRMYLVNHIDLSSDTEGLAHLFDVAGSTGNIYHVIICRVPSCDCPDFQRHATNPTKGGVVCKHLILVYLKVLKLPPDSHILYQKGLLQEELQEAFSRLPKRKEEEKEALREIMANAETREAYLAQLNGGAAGEKGEKGEEGEEDQKGGAGGAAGGGGVVDLLAGETECPVCLDDFGNERIVNCVTCRKPTHQNCFNIWNGTQVASGLPLTCVWCRSKWIDPAAVRTTTQTSPDGKRREVAGVELVQGISVGERGHINVAQLTGQSGVRDDSTYSEWGGFGGGGGYGGYGGGGGGGYRRRNHGRWRR